MFSGYVGADYEAGRGLLLVAINPGGGGDAYNRRIPEDEILYPVLAAFKNATAQEVLRRFEEVNEAFARVVRNWNLWRILAPTLEAAGMQLSEVAYINVVPYRTREDKMPPARARAVGWELVVRPTLRLLRPRAIVTLGKKAGSVVEPFVPADISMFCVPRTIGDSYVSEEARAIHARMSAELVDSRVDEP